MSPRRQKGTQEYEDWLNEVISLAEAASLRKISVETLRREGKLGRFKILKLSERRLGMQRREALKGIQD